MANHFKGFHTTPSTASIDQTDKGQPHLQSIFLAVARFVPDFCIRGPTAHCKVISTDNDTATINISGAQHKVRGREVFKFTLAIVVSAAGQCAYFMKRAWINECIDAFTHG